MRHVAIAGAGIGGLAAALALADAGCRVTLFERASAIGEVGAGLQLSPNACSALRGLGVLEEVKVEAVALEALRIGRGRDAALLARLPLGEAVVRRFGAPFLVTLRADLHRVLRRRVEASAAISLVTGASLTGWTAIDGGGLRLAFENAALPRANIDGLVGADGLHSTVLSRVATASGVSRARGTAWRTTIEADRLPPRFSESASNLWLGRGAHLVHYPVARGALINVVACIDGAPPSSERLGGWSTPGDPAEIASRFARWAPAIRQLIATAPAWGRWPLLDRPPLARWSHGPITLLGDAAHPMLPFLAQGAAQALEDAAALGEAVASHREDLSTAFSLYESRRRDRAARVQNESRRQATLYHLPAPGSLLRDIVLLKTAPEKLLARYDWLYSGLPAGRPLRA